MKKLLLASLLIASVAWAQLPEGINKEHMETFTPSVQKNSGFEVKRIALKTGVELEYIEQGNDDGIPVIFLHGLSDSWHSFEYAFKYLPSNVHAFAISQRGHGNSGKPKQGYAPRDFAADIAAFIQKKNLEKVVVAGHSMGGVNAQQFAISYPSLTRALVIIDSDPAMHKNQGMPEFYDAVKQLQGQVITYQFMLEFQQSTLAKPIDSAWFNLLVDEGLKCPVPVFKTALGDMVKADLTQGLKKLSMPVLIFWGDKDTVCLEEGQEKMKQALKNETQLVYEGTGHALHWEQPERFANDLTKFLNGLPK